MAGPSGAGFAAGMRPLALCASLLVAATPTAAAQAGLAELEPIQVTATREAEPVANVPASVTVVSGSELVARGATDLRTALSLVAGVQATPGGDSGPAGAVPALWGLQEQDAFLLVVDGVPSGGAFNPATSSIDMIGVERIEVLRGPAPVMYGSTSFAGVIHVIHYAAGEAPTRFSLSGGSHGSYALAGVANLPSTDTYRQSLAVNLERRGYSVDRQDYQRAHAYYRGEADLAGGRLYIDADMSRLNQRPGNVIFRNGARLRTDIIPLDANHNPSDARASQDRAQLNLRLERGTALGAWSTTLSVTGTHDRILRGFLRDYAPLTGNITGDPDKPDDFDADGYSQARHVTDVYFDTHLVRHLGQAARLTYGVDYLHGGGWQSADNFGYYIGLDGYNPPRGAAQHVDEIAMSRDTRDFGGLYSQLDWSPNARIDALLGIRLNGTRESTSGRAVDNTGAAPVVAFTGSDRASRTRPSGAAGVTWHVVNRPDHVLSLYADYRNTYKPLAVDFGPEAEVGLLEPETAQSYEAGAKGSLSDSRVVYDLSVFRLDFRNLKTFDDAGDAVNAGRTRFTGAEVEARVAVTPDLQLAATYSYHDSRFLRFRRSGGAGGVVDGNRLELAPFHLAGLGLIYAPARVFNASITCNYVGQRFLDKGNTLSAGGYVTVDMTIGYRFARYSVRLTADNLTDRRVPVSESELANTVSGAASYYLLPARRIMLEVAMGL